MRQIVFILIYIVCCSCASVHQTAQNTPSITLPDHNVQHLVIKGDSLWRLSQTYATSVESIMRTNNIASTRDLKVGETILIPTDSGRYALPASFIWPTQGKIIASFGQVLKSSRNKGIDITANPNHPIVVAVADGRIVFAQAFRGWNTMVIIKHPANIYSIYANLSTASIRSGDLMRQGQPIGTIAANARNEHVLHFELRHGYRAIDPVQCLNQKKYLVS